MPITLEKHVERTIKRIKKAQDLQKSWEESIDYFVERRDHTTAAYARGQAQGLSKWVAGEKYHLRFLRSLAR